MRNIKVITGHLTAKDKQIVKQMFEIPLMDVVVGKTQYTMSLENEVYTLKIKRPIAD